MNPQITIDLRLILEIAAVVLALLAGWTARGRDNKKQMVFLEIKQTILLLTWFRALLMTNKLKISDNFTLAQFEPSESEKNISDTLVKNIDREKHFSKMLRSFQ